MICISVKFEMTIMSYQNDFKHQVIDKLLANQDFS